MAKKTYSEADFQSHQGLQAVRKRPQMYIGTTDGHGLFTLIKEPADNGVDEHLAGRNDYCHLILDATCNWIIDHSDGIPVGPITIEAHGMKLKMPALQGAVGEMHTGGKFSAESGAYGDGSRGVHGIGIKATNALSSRFDVWTRRDGKIYHIGYAKGSLIDEMEVVKTFPKLPFGATTSKDTGTVVCFTPDLSCFDKGSKLDPKLVHEWAELTSFLNAGLTVDVTTAKGTNTYFSEEGAVAYVDATLADHEATALGNYLVINHKYFDVALAFTDYDGVAMYGYTNGLHNPDGGVHVDLALRVVGQQVLAYKGARQEFKAADVSDGIVGIINVKIASPTFSNQIKDKLIDTRVAELITEAITAEVAAFFKGEKALTKKICERAANMRSLKDEFKSNKEAMRELKGGRGRKLPSKLMRSNAAPADVELFLMEGDSAGGSAAKARDRSYQEVLPLRGKILNVYKLGKGERIWDSEEVMNILQAIGYNPESESPASSLRVGKIILLGDADVDGYHVNLLNLCLLSKVVPEVFKRGMVYVARGYEYVIETPDRNYYADSPTEMTKTAPANLMHKLLHLKGWGEVSARGLKEMAFDTASRKLYRITAPDAKSIPHLAHLMGPDVEGRKQKMLAWDKE